MANKAGPPRIKNYTSDASEDAIFGTIRSVLVAHKAKRITFDQDDEGYSTAIEFRLEIGTGTNSKKKPYNFRLPVRVEAVEPLVAKAWQEMGKPLSGDRLRDQAYRTAWANVRDWIAAHMALVDSQMFTAAEVFFPFLLMENTGSETQTAFQVFEQQRALPSPTQGRDFTVTEVV